MPNDEEILKELKKISRIIAIGNGSAIAKELEKYATSGDRKKIWVLLDGTRQSDDIAKIIGKTNSAVNIFLKILEDVDLVERSYGKPPTRSLDYVPPSWTGFLENIRVSEEKKEESLKDQPEQKEDQNV